jgi:hypothetical protein
LKSHSLVGLRRCRLFFRVDIRFLVTTVIKAVCEVAPKILAASCNTILMPSTRRVYLRDDRRLIRQGVPTGVNYWIFTVTTQRSDGRVFSAQEILGQRMKDGFWGLGERTPNRKNVQKGDRVVFYLGNPVKAFGASACLATSSFELSEQEKQEVSHGLNLYRPPYGVRLEQIKVWEKLRSIEELIPELSFIENKDFWGPYFQGGVRLLGEKDFSTIMNGDLGIGHNRPSLPANGESKAEFALETHLEEFMDQNWNGIDFGSQLQRYEVEEQSGRQFPLGPWSADFLCCDKQTGDFVVVELKRGKTSDTTVGQILRYMAYVKETLAQPGQSVRGIIVAKEVEGRRRKHNNLQLYRLL